MKNNAIVINVARGAVCDESALAAAILNGKIYGLGVDVFTQEPYPVDHPFTKIADVENVILTPHMAWGSYESRVRCRDEAILNLESFLKGERRNRLV